MWINLYKTTQLESARAGSQLWVCVTPMAPLQPPLALLPWEGVCAGCLMQWEGLEVTGCEQIEGGYRRGVSKGSRRV